MSILSKVAATLFLGWLAAGCTHPRQVRAIALQPIAFSDTAKLREVQQEVHGLFGCPVYLLKDIPMPPSFLNRTKGERYSADSILAWLGQRKPDSVSILVGLTGKDIFTMKKGEVWGILGLGYCPGHACVISDARFRGTAPGLYDHRLRAITFHEIGHNLGLPHCKTPHCIMNDAEGRIATVDSCGEHFCAACRRQPLLLTAQGPIVPIVLCFK